MSQKSNLSARISQILIILAGVCGVAAFCMFFANCVVFSPPILGKSAYSGLQTAFGYTESGIEIFHGSVGVALSFILPLIAACAAVAGKESKIATVAAALLFVAAAILAFCIPQTAVGNFAVQPKLGSGAITCGILSAGGAASVALSFFLAK